MTPKKSSKAVKPKSQPKSASKVAPAPKKTVKDFAKKVAKKVKQTPKETAVDKKIGDSEVEQPHIETVVEEFDVLPAVEPPLDDAPAEIPLEPQRPEVEAAKLDENKEYAAEVALPVVESPSGTYTYSLDQPYTLIPLMKDAWNAVRPKSDAPFEVCAPAFRETLLAHATDVIKTNKTRTDDAPLAQFERKVYELIH